jgi:plasmid stabilization system protein ParE
MSPRRMPAPGSSVNPSSTRKPRRDALFLNEDADRDLDVIWDYIAADNVDAADRWIGKLFDASDAIGHTPGIGHKREDLTAYPVLFWPVGAFP